MKGLYFLLCFSLSANANIDEISRADKCQLFYEELLDLHRQVFYQQMSLWDLLNEVEIFFLSEADDDFFWCVEQLRIDTLPTKQPGILQLQPTYSL